MLAIDDFLKFLFYELNNLIEVKGLSYFNAKKLIIIVNSKMKSLY